MGGAEAKPPVAAGQPAPEPKKEQAQLPAAAGKTASAEAKVEAPRKGGKLLDKYVLGKLLGQGAFGVVYKCRKKGSTHDFAVKMIDQVETPLNEIEKEVQMLQVLKHPSVIELHEVFYEKVFVCMVLELYKGGDMIQGMMAHWKSKGMIPMDAVRHLTKQMWEGIAFLHARHYVHRDVKGDNFMMDLPAVENLSNRIYLSDFGTVVELKEGQRLTQKCGTKNYWSPEFFKMNYSYKVDVWATGVIMFGFFVGKFPFKNEQEVNSKKLQMHPRVGEEGEKLLMSVFTRDETKRCEAAEAMKHPFVCSEEKGPAEVEDLTFKAEIKESGADAGIAARRRELVDRLVQNAKQYQDELGGGSPTSKTPQQHRDESVVVDNLDDATFKVTDNHSKRAITFKWTKEDDARNLLAVLDSCQHTRTAAVNQDISTDTIRAQLKNHDIDLTKWGTGTAKPVEEFIREIQMGKARLLIDATRPKFLVRGVDAVLLRIFVKTPTGKKYLIERQEKFPDGRIRESGRLPGHMRGPHENAIQAAERLVEDLLQMQDCKIVFDFGHIDTSEQGEESPSYPGVHTVYIKQTVTGVVTIKDPEVLKRIGVSDFGGLGKIDVEDKQKYTRSFQWMTEADCLGAQIQLRPRASDDDISALVYPPVGLSPDDLFAYLTDNNVDVSKWGEGTAKSVAEFSEELVKGESALLRQENGRVVRVVDIVVLKMRRRAAGGSEVLREIEENVQEQAKTLDRLPATKRRVDVHPFAAARKMIATYMHMDNNLATLDPDDVKVESQEQESVSYPGLLSIYRKHYMSVELNSSPVGRADSSP